MPGCPEARENGVSCQVFVAVQAATNASYTLTLVTNTETYSWIPQGMPTVRYRVVARTCFSER